VVVGKSIKKLATTVNVVIKEVENMTSMSKGLNSEQKEGIDEGEGGGRRLLFDTLSKAPFLSSYIDQGRTWQWFGTSLVRHLLISTLTGFGNQGVRSQDLICVAVGTSKSESSIATKMRPRIMHSMLWPEHITSVMCASPEHQ
jgi:hypothetical protein